MRTAPVKICELRAVVFILLLFLGLHPVNASLTPAPAALRELNYTINLANQIDSRSNEDRIEVIGVAHPEATVKVNGDPGTYRRGEYFRKELPVANNSYPTITVTAEYGGQIGTKTGETFIPPATEDFQYDNDGNVTFDGRWEYTWDGENQLVADALKNPKKIVDGVDKQGRPFQIFTGGNARMVVNPQRGKVISLNPLSGAGAH